jgi:predicted NAD-dependent protein-ADP-ribosyltransferase YbiA (DUF1768 family)
MFQPMVSDEVQEEGVVYHTAEHYMMVESQVI